MCAFTVTPTIPNSEAVWFNLHPTPYPLPVDHCKAVFLRHRLYPHILPCVPLAGMASLHSEVDTEKARQATFYPTPL